MTHLTDEQIVGRLYGVSTSAADAHVSACDECLERFEAAERRRALLTGFKPVSPAHLARQRAAILARLQSGDAPRSFLRWAWAPALGAAALVYAGFYFWPAAPSAAIEPAAASTVDSIDVNWYDEVYQHIELMEPRAATPIRELFQEEAATE